MEIHVWEELAAKLRTLLTFTNGDVDSCATSMKCLFSEKLSLLAELLEQVLLPLDEQHFMRCRLQNAWLYYTEEELGAAHYELELALRRIRQLQQLYSW